MAEETDNKLYTRLKRGDVNALTSIFHLYYGPLCRFVFLFVPEKEIVEELAANVFVSLWEQRKKINIHTSLRAYLYRCARNQAMSYIRKQKLKIIPLDASIVDNYINEGSPESIFIEAELEFDFVQIFEKLPPRARMAFKLHRFDGLKYSEVAEIMNISVPAVEKNITLALKIFRAELAVQMKSW